MRHPIVFALAVTVAAGMATAQHAGHSGHTGHAGQGSPSKSQNAKSAPSTAAFEAANAKMHADMAIAFTGNADVDFVRGMIPHHEGAVAMAEIVLKHGKDPAIRKLAEDVIKAQKGEIAMMKAWLAKNAK